jgi:hypothetical protein
MVAPRRSRTGSNPNVHTHWRTLGDIAKSLPILLKSRQDTLSQPTQGDYRMKTTLKSAAPAARPADKTSAPRYDVFVVENYDGGAGHEKSSWTRLGVAFAHKDNKGMNVELRAVPITGKLVIRLHDSKGDAAD